MISIVMAVYNEEKYIRQAIESIITQSYRNLELIVVNDGSTDSTYKIIEELKIKDARIKAINPGKVGKNTAFNLGVASAAGDWIGLFAGDDIMEAGVIENLMSIAQQYAPQKQAVLIGALQRSFAEEEKYKFEDNVVVPFKNIDGIFGNTVGIISRSLCDKSFPVPEAYPNEDGWLTLAYRYLSDKRIQTPFIYTNYRIHANNSYDHAAVDFSVYNEAYHKRRIVIKEFCETHRECLSDVQFFTLSQLYRLELLRYKGKFIKIILCRGVPWREKVKALFFSNATLNHIKVRLSRYVLGRL